MRRSLRTLLAAALVAVFLCLQPAALSQASPRGDWWIGQAKTALRLFEQADSGRENAFTYAQAAGAVHRLYGWADPRARVYLDRVLALRNPDGGWGLSRSYDAFADGSMNPPDTTYTITLAGHVGPVLLAAYQAGLVDRAVVQRIVDLLVTAPRVPVDRGTCVAYSLHPNDTGPGMCVHNVSTATASFLQDAAVAGFGATGMHGLIVGITLHEVDAYRPATGYWPYIAAGPDQDADHQTSSSQPMYRLAYWLGREAIYRQMTTAEPDDRPENPLARIALTATPGGPASWSRTVPGLPLWCELGDAWRSEVAEFIAAPPAPQATRWAQAAHGAARAGRNCAAG